MQRFWEKPIQKHSVCLSTALYPFHFFNKGSSGPFPCFHSVTQGLGLLKRERLSDSEHPLNFSLIPTKNSKGKPKGWEWGHKKSWEYFPTYRIRDWGQSWKDTISLPASALDYTEQNGRLYCFPLGLEFCYFSWFSPSLSKTLLPTYPYLIPTPHIEMFPLTKGAIVSLPTKE